MVNVDWLSIGPPWVTVIITITLFISFELVWRAKE